MTVTKFGSVAIFLNTWKKKNDILHLHPFKFAGKLIFY